jgi:hypothetical protein
MYFLKTKNCEGLSSYIWLNTVNVAYETVIVLNEYLCTLYDMQFNIINHKFAQFNQYGDNRQVGINSWQIIFSSPPHPRPVLTPIQPPIQ